MNKKNTDNIVKKIMSRLTPLIEARINELGSTTYYDAATKADRYYNRDLAKKFRQAGDEARKRELQSSEYDNPIDQYDEITIDNTTKIVLGKYKPVNINFIALLRATKRCDIAIARVTKTDLVNIRDIKILNDIASLYKRKAIAKDNLEIISSNLNKDISEAKKLANAVNTCFNTNINWRYFYGDKRKVNKENTKDRLNQNHQNFKIDSQTRCFVVKPINQMDEYIIYYIIIGNAKTSSIMRIYDYGHETIKVDGVGQINPIFNVILNDPQTAEKAKEIAEPTKTTCEMPYLYNKFKNMDIKKRTAIFKQIKNMLSFKITMDDIEAGYERWKISKNAEKKGRGINVTNSPATTSDDMDDYMDL